MEESGVKEHVKERYGEIAKREGSCCPSSCCGPSALDMALKIGYSVDDLRKSRDPLAWAWAAAIPSHLPA